jgi:hypothetical protein
VSPQKKSKKTAPMNFTSMKQSDVPRGRIGKHNAVVGQILSDLDQTNDGRAVKVPLSGLTSTKAKVRSALNRATRKGGRQVMTASDDEFLYVWNEKKKTSK